MTPAPSTLAPELLVCGIVAKMVKTRGLFDVLPTVPLLDRLSDPMKGVTPTPQVLLENNSRSNHNLGVLRRQRQCLLQQWKGGSGISQTSVVFRQRDQYRWVSRVELPLFLCKIFRLPVSFE